MTAVEALFFAYIHPGDSSPFHYVFCLHFLISLHFSTLPSCSPYFGAPVSIFSLLLAIRSTILQPLPLPLSPLPNKQPTLPLPPSPFLLSPENLAVLVLYSPRLNSLLAFCFCLVGFRVVLLIEQTSSTDHPRSQSLSLFSFVLTFTSPAPI